ncbi:hypothetical protein GEV33_006532 [Tenebrio molitor]|uniref:Uncharacterized protein n=1 Tax=Tenebrio molitor TaxID=7067 RepID=A0A8J6HKD5_TENMO|nr:hypothetical protein GEV33_006532 [Tenebrio molitor]
MEEFILHVNIGSSDAEKEEDYDDDEEQNCEHLDPKNKQHPELKQKLFFAITADPALLNFYGKEKYIKIDDCRKILKGLFLYGKDTTRAENRANELYKGDSWFGSESEQTWKKCSDSKRKQRRVSESPGRVEASQEDKKKRKRAGKGKTGRQEEEEEEEVFGTSKKTARSPEVEKKSGREMEKILEKLEEVKREIREEIKELRKENQEVKREIEQLREEFKNKEKMDTLAAHRCGLMSSGQTGWG